MQAQKYSRALERSVRMQYIGGGVSQQMPPQQPPSYTTVIESTTQEHTTDESDMWAEIWTWRSSYLCTKPQRSHPPFFRLLVRVFNFEL